MFAREPAAHDWRLIVAAVALWAAALLGLLLHWGFTILIGASAVTVAVGLLIVRPRATDQVSVAWPLLVCGLLAAWPVAARIHAAAADPLRELAVGGESVELRVEIDERPRPIRTPGFGAMQAGVQSVVIPATVIGTDGIPSTGEILLLAPVDKWSRLLPGQQATVSGTLAPAKGGQLTVALLRVRGPPDAVGAAPAIQRIAEDLRAGLREAASVLSPEQAGLLPALVVGDTDRLAVATVDDFRVAGLAHLLAVSGANLAVVCVAVLLVLRALRVGPRGAAAGALLALLGFVVLAGPEPSVLRAGVMGAVGLLALALGRERSALPALGVAVITLILFDPGMAVAFGFVLSVLATGALVLLAPPWSEALVRRRVPRVLADALTVPAAAHLVTAPVVAGMSGQVSLVAIAANLLAAPVIAPATVLGVLAAVSMPVWSWLAELLVRLAGPEVGWLIAVGQRAANIPGAAMAWPGGWLGGALLLLIAGTVLVVARMRRARTVVAVVLVGLLLVVIPIRVISPGWPPPGWAVVACDVGQGDAIALATAEPNRAVMVDTGPDPGPAGDCLDRLDIDRVPVVILSHLHADHVGGLESILAGRAVGAVAVGPGRSPAWAWRQVLDVAKAAGVPVVELVAGQRMAWPGLELEVLSPSGNGSRDSEDAAGTEINNQSLVLRATTSIGRVLLTGDIELAAQAELLREGTDLAADVMKVPHHGSRYTAPDFLAAVRPRIALVSVGTRNRYGHPNPGTLATLTGRGALVMRTDLGGDSAVVRDAGHPAAVSRGEPRSPPGK
ncbi:MAG: DNA internalization-related competence protein ComEC/Rec2 [Actinomycetota bacterium]|nr:DNA internalization-related competence protein ComEC/Rec2 [Actinomycetota bacterium]